MARKLQRGHAVLHRRVLWYPCLRRRILPRKTSLPQLLRSAPGCSLYNDGRKWCPRSAVNKRGIRQRGYPEITLYLPTMALSKSGCGSRRYSLFSARFRELPFSVNYFIRIPFSRQVSGPGCNDEFSCTNYANTKGGARRHPPIIQGNILN